MDAPKSTDYILVVIAIIGLIISIVLSIFFSFIPISKTYSIVQQTAKDTEAAINNVNAIAEDLRISALQTIDTLSRIDRLEAAICKDIPSLLPSFCGN